MEPAQELLTYQESTEGRDFDDPKKYFDEFRAGYSYRTQFEKFFEGKNLAPQVTEEMKHDVFIRSERAGLALLQFYQNQNIFVYNPDNIPEESRAAIGDYVGSVETWREAIKERNQEKLIECDELRKATHERAATTLLKEGLAPSQYLAKLFCRFILWNKGLEAAPIAKFTNENYDNGQKIQIF